MSRRRPPDTSKPPASAPRWIVSYASLFTILLAFFICLSSLRPKQGFDIGAKGMIESFVKGFNAHGLSSFLLGSKRPTRMPYVQSHFVLESMRRDDIDAAAYEGRTVDPNDIRVSKTIVETLDAGTRVILPVPVRFGGDGTRLAPDSTRTLGMIAASLRDGTCAVSVEASVSDAGAVPSSQGTPWSFTARRAMEVARFLQYSCGISEERLEIVGCGVGHPLIAPRAGEALDNHVLLVLVPVRPTPLRGPQSPLSPRIVARPE